MSNHQTHSAKKSGTANRAQAGAAKRAVSSKAKQQSAVSISPPVPIAAEERHRRIAEAAYYRALHRGFHGGADLEDWLESEAEIDRLILRT